MNDRFGRDGLVAPFGNTKTREKLFCNLDEAVSRNLLATSRNGDAILLFDCSTDCRNAATQNFFGNGALCLWQFGQDCIDIDAQWTNALCLRTLWQLWWRIKELTARTISVLALSTSFVAVLALTTWAITVGTITTWSLALVTIARTFFGELLRHWFECAFGWKELEETSTLRLGLWCGDRQHACAVEICFDVCAHDIAD